MWSGLYKSANKHICWISILHIHMLRQNQVHYVLVHTESCLTKGGFHVVCFEDLRTLHCRTGNPVVLLLWGVVISFSHPAAGCCCCIRSGFMSPFGADVQPRRPCEDGPRSRLVCPVEKRRWVKRWPEALCDTGFLLPLTISASLTLMIRVRQTTHLSGKALWLIAAWMVRTKHFRHVTLWPQGYVCMVAFALKQITHWK